MVKKTSNFVTFLQLLGPKTISEDYLPFRKGPASIFCGRVICGIVAHGFVRACCGSHCQDDTQLQKGHRLPQSLFAPNQNCQVRLTFPFRRWGSCLLCCQQQFRPQSVFGCWPCSVLFHVCWCFGRFGCLVCLSLGWFGCV